MLRTIKGYDFPRHIWPPSSFSLLGLFSRTSDYHHEMPRCSSKGWINGPFSSPGNIGNRKKVLVSTFEGQRSAITRRSSFFRISLAKQAFIVRDKIEIKLCHQNHRQFALWRRPFSNINDILSNWLRPGPSTRDKLETVSGDKFNWRKTPFKNHACIGKTSFVVVFPVSPVFYRSEEKILIG